MRAKKPAEKNKNASNIILFFCKIREFSVYNILSTDIKGIFVKYYLIFP